MQGEILIELLIAETADGKSADLVVAVPAHVRVVVVQVADVGAVRVARALRSTPEVGAVECIEERRTAAVACRNGGKA